MESLEGKGRESDSVSASQDMGQRLAAVVQVSNQRALIRKRLICQSNPNAHLCQREMRFAEISANKLVRVRIQT